MSEVRFTNVTKSYGAQVAVNDISLSINSGEFLTLLGPSGCGKTTSLRMVAGFATPTSGQIHIDGRDVTRTEPNSRNTGMVFQSFALFPHLTVAENVRFGLKVRKIKGSDADARAAEAIRLVRLDGFESRYPRQLSGGQQQRVALARAVVIEPDVLLLDEPLSALDLKLRHELQIHIRHVQQTLKVTTIYVTHDQGEALRMSDRVAVMHRGCVAQIDTPQELYDRPKTAFVANFIGQANVIDVVTGDKEGDGKGVSVHLPDDPGQVFRVEGGGGVFAPRSEAALVFRPEVVQLGYAQANRLRGKVERAAYSGSVWNVTVSTEKGLKLDLELGYAVSPPKIGAICEFSWPPERTLLVERNS